jgi:hypothetical protein
LSAPPRSDAPFAAVWVALRLRLRSHVAPLLVVYALLALCACDALGNPPSRSRTPETTTQVGAFTLTTRTETVTAARSAELLRRIEGRPHHVDAGRAPYLTLVVVDVAPRGATLPRFVSLATDLAFASGEAQRRQWLAPGNARPFVALFGTTTPPSAARTIRGR